MTDRDSYVGGSSRPGEFRFPVDRLLLQSVDLGLAGSIFMVPLLMGGRHPLGHFVLVSLAIWVAVSWCLRQACAARPAWVFSPIDPLLLVAPAVIGLQLIPLPHSVLDNLSPRLFETLPLWAPPDQAAGSLGVWNTLSMTPGATRGSLVLAMAFSLLLGITLQRVRQLEDVERLLRWIACSVAIVAVFGLVQYFMGNGKFFWFYQHPFSGTNTVVKGSFVNPNHFGQFLALGVGPLIWWMHRSMQGRDRNRPTGSTTFGRGSRSTDASSALLVVVLGVVLFAGLMSRSRGGAMAILVAAGVCLLVLYRGRLIHPKIVLAAVGIGALVLASLFIHGYKSVANELDDFTSFKSLDGEGGRRRLWMANLEGFADYPVLGTGAGSHCNVIPLYYRDPSIEYLNYTHAENSYVQPLLETGVPGALLMLLAVGFCVYWCVALLRQRLSARQTTCLAAIAAGLVASFVHAMADYIWYIPGCLLFMLMLGVCAYRLRQLSGEPSESSFFACPVSRLVWSAGAVCLVLAGGLMLKNRLAAIRGESSWHAYLLLNQAMREREPAELSSEDLQAMAERLAETVRWQPDHGQAHAQLARIHQMLFEEQPDSEVCPFNVGQVREAAIASRFQSPEALREWLGRAFPERWKHLETAWHHAHLATRHAPLEAEGYLQLSEVSFFDGPHAPTNNAFIEQALRIRPCDGGVLFKAGHESLLAGNWNDAFERWQQSYRVSPRAQEQLEEFLAGKVPVATFVEIFQPDATALERMRRYYQELGLKDEQREVLQHYVIVSEEAAQSLQGTPASQAWRRTANTFHQLQNPTEQLRCLRNALDCDPGQQDTCHALGTCLCKLGQFAEAEKYLKRCVQWKPQDKKLRAELEAAINGRLRMGSRPDELPRR